MISIHQISVRQVLIAYADKTRHPVNSIAVDRDCAGLSAGIDTTPPKRASPARRCDHDRRIGTTAWASTHLLPRLDKARPRHFNQKLVLVDTAQGATSSGVPASAERAARGFSLASTLFELTTRIGAAPECLHDRTRSPWHRDQATCDHDGTWEKVRRTRTAVRRALVPQNDKNEELLEATAG